MRKLLHVGCGAAKIEHTTPGFNNGEWEEVRLDIDSGVKPDVVASMLDMAVVSDGSVDAVFSSHAIEHLYPHEVAVALAEFRRVLSPQGFVVITCPDLQEVCKLVAENKLLEPAYVAPCGPIAPLDILFGFRAAVAAGNFFMAHHGGFTASSLVSALVGVGFGNAMVFRQPGAFALWAVATIEPGDETTLRELAKQYFP